MVLAGGWVSRMLRQASQKVTVSGVLLITVAVAAAHTSLVLHTLQAGVHTLCCWHMPHLMLSCKLLHCITMHYTLHYK
jgi:hypothetical protein